MVAGRAVRKKALANKTSLFFGLIPCLRAALAFENSNSVAGARIKHLELKNPLGTAVTGGSRVRLIFGKYFVLEISVHDAASPLRASRPLSYKVNISSFKITDLTTSPNAVVEPIHTKAMPVNLMTR